MGLKFSHEMPEYDGGRGGSGGVKLVHDGGVDVAKGVVLGAFKNA